MSPTTHGTHLVIRQLQKNFGVKSVLGAIDLEVAPGEFVAIVGKSGCGKSTLLRLIAGLETPTGGEIFVDRTLLRGHNHAACVMFQDARLVPWKRVEDNVGLGLKQDAHAGVHRALDQVGLLDRAGEWPAVLSGGERQRVALARAVVREPHCLLLDEPLGALDALTRLEMQRLLEQVWREQGFTTILITHDVEEAIALADRVVLIEQGRIALDIAVTLPRPRQRGSAAFAALKDTVLSRVMGWTKDEAPDESVRILPMTTRAERGLAQVS